MNRLVQKFHSLLVRTMLLLLPHKARRMIFVVSFVQFLHGSEKLKEETTREIYRIMQLDYSPSAAQFPIHITDVIWTSEDERELCLNEVRGCLTELDDETIHQVITKAHEHNKYWHLFDDHTSLKEFVYHLLTDHRFRVFKKT